MDKIIFKLCRNCEKKKPLNDFHKWKYSKDGYRTICKKCRKIEKDSNKNYRMKYPWKITFQGIKQRCNNKNCKDYKRYGGRGIKCLITNDELKQLWFRDKAYLMKRPSIDRINNNGDYVYDNCRFIEMNINNRKDKGIKIQQFNLYGYLLAEYTSIKVASDINKISKSSILNAINNINVRTYKYIWRKSKLEGAKC